MADSASFAPHTATTKLIYEIKSHRELVNRHFQFNKRSQLFIGTHYKLLSIAMRINKSGAFLIPKPAKCFTLTDHDSLITYHSLRFGAVSSVVERLVYTERVGGSNPSPPNSQ